MLSQVLRGTLADFGFANRDLVQVRASDTALFVMTLMRDNQIFSIPVVDDETGALLAIAQGKDIVRYR